MTPVPDPAKRVIAALLCWLALVVWGSAIVNLYPAVSDAATQGYRVVVSALAAPAIVWMFWLNTSRTALALSATALLSGGIVLALQS